MLTKETGAVWQGGAFAPHKVSPQANLGGGGIHFRRAFQISTDTIKKATPIRCGLFMVETTGLELLMDLFARL